MKSITRAASAAVVTAGTVVAIGLASTPAEADRATFKDARGDIAHGADLHSVKVVTGHRLRIDLRTDDLVRSWRSGASTAVYLDTDREEKGPEYAFLGGLFEGTDYALVRTNGWRIDHHPGLVRAFHRLRIDYRRDVAHLRISRKALDGAEEVRIAVQTAGERAGGKVVRDWLGERRSFTPWMVTPWRARD
jgi:hypothetical protein